MKEPEEAEMKLCQCSGCGKEYLGSTEDPEVCFACWMANHTEEEIDEILKKAVPPDDLVGAGGWDFYKMPNTIRAMSRADVLDYLANCPKSRKIWRAVGHNSASPNGCGIAIPRGFQAYHISKGWSDIGYHWVIDTCGTIYIGRNLVYQGAHAHAEGNIGSMGWCWVGNFSGGGGLPSKEQIDSARFLCGAHRATFGYGCESEYGHRWVVYPEHATSCPGTNITSQQMLRNWVCGSTPPPPPPKKKGRYNDMIVPFEKVEKEGGLFVFVAAEGWCDLDDYKAECWLIIKNEDSKPAKVQIFTTPWAVGGKSDITVPVKTDPASRVAVNMKNFRPKGGFATTVKSNVANIVPQISMTVEKK